MFKIILDDVVVCGLRFDAWKVTNNSNWKRHLLFSACIAIATYGAIYHKVIFIEKTRLGIWTKDGRHVWTSMWYGVFRQFKPAGRRDLALKTWSKSSFPPFLTQLTDWLTDWLTDRLTDWLTDWPTDRPTEISLNTFVLLAQLSND